MTPIAQTLRVATYNVHGCVGIDRQRSEARIAEVIAGMSADLVGLQELDSSRPRSAGVDQAALLAGQLGWKHCFHPAMRHADEQYGNAILSRFPLTIRRAAELPGVAPWYCREKRVAIWAEAETHFGPVHIMNTHFGLSRSERLLQAQLLAGAEWLGSIGAGEPVVLLGDFNSLPGSRSHRLLCDSLRDTRALASERRAFRTFPTRFATLAVDHIFISREFELASLSVYRTPLSRIASDHYPLIAQLALSPLPL